MYVCLGFRSENISCKDSFENKNKSYMIIPNHYTTCASMYSCVFVCEHVCACVSMCVCVRVCMCEKHSFVTQVWIALPWDSIYPKMHHSSKEHEHAQESIFLTHTDFNTEITMTCFVEPCVGIYKMIPRKYIKSLPSGTSWKLEWLIYCLKMQTLFL